MFLESVIGGVIIIATHPRCDLLYLSAVLRDGLWTQQDQYISQEVQEQE